MLTSLRNHWSGLIRFVDDPDLPMDNNQAERALRGPVVGRKNYYGSGATWSGELTATLFSLFHTQPRHGLPRGAPPDAGALLRAHLQRAGTGADP